MDAGSVESSSTNEGVRGFFEGGDKEELSVTSAGFDENVEFGNSCLK
jgi:hypothetical protein